LRVGLDNHIYLGRDKHYYSVHYDYIGEKVQVIYTRTMVRIYCKNEKIATHERIVGFGYSTVSDHLCSAHQHYNKRSPGYYIETAKRKSAVLVDLITAIFNRPQAPELFYRTCDGLLSLCRKTDLARFEKACQIALDNNELTCRYVKSLVTGNSLLMEPEDCKPLPSPKENIRGKQYYK
jgi:hypothetical protein